MRFGSEIDDAGAEDLDQLEDLRAVLRGGGYFDERELAGDGGGLRNVVDVDDILKLEETGANAVAGLGRCFADQGEAREAGALAAPTVSELMLMFKRRKREATRVSTPGKSST